MTRSEVDPPRDEQSTHVIPAPPFTDRGTGRTPSDAFRSHVRSRLPCRPVSPHQARSRAVPPRISLGRWPYGIGYLQVAREPQACDGDRDEPQANHGSPTQPSQHARRHRPSGDALVAMVSAGTGERPPLEGAQERAGMWISCERCGADRLRGSHQRKPNGTICACVIACVLICNHVR
jgi:hypothetical protein